MTSTSLHRRVGFALLALGVAASAAAFSFVLHRSTGLPIKWPVGNIPVRIMLGDTPTLSDGQNYNTSARSAAQTWNGIMGSAQIVTTFGTGSPTNNNDVNEVGFSSTIFGRPFDSGTLAVTTGSSLGNERTEADIIFNSSVNWDSYTGNLRSGSDAAIDLRRVALHEFGHVLGLDHPDENGQQVSAIMNSRVGDLYIVRDDDIAGMRKLYGPNGVPANDNFANAFVLSLNGSQSTSGSDYNCLATREAGDPRQGDNPGGRSVWWRWTAPSSGPVTLDTGKENPSTHVTDVPGGQSSVFDTTLGVYTGTALSNLT